MEKIIEKIRDLIDDNLKSALDIEEYLTSNIFTLSEANPDEDTISVYVNGAEHNSSGDWSFDSSTNKLTVSGLTTGDIVEINYNAYIKYSDTELKAYLRSALVYISTEHYKDFMNKSDYLFPTPEESEENLIALVASILIKDTIRSYRTPELTIQFQDGLSKEQKITKAVKSFKKAYGIVKYVDLGEQIEIEDE